MTDDIDTMRDTLRAAKPSSTARTRGMDGAMAAFDSEFSADDEKNAPPVQGSDAGRRLTSRKGRTGRAEPRRTKMSRLSTLTMAVGGTGIAAVLALFIVVQNDDLSGIRIGDWSMSSSRDDMAELGRLEDVPADFRQMAEAEADIADAEISAIAATPAPQITAEAPRIVAIPGKTGSVTRQVTGNPASARRVAVPGKTATIQTRVIDTPASVRRVAVPGKIAAVPNRALDEQVAVSGATAKLAQDSIAALLAPPPPPAPASQARNENTQGSAANGAGRPAAEDERQTYSLRRIAVPGKAATITKRIQQADGSIVTRSVSLSNLEPYSESTQIVPGSGGNILAPKGYKLQINPATYETVTDEIPVFENWKGEVLETRSVRRRVIDTPQSFVFVPIDPASTLAPIPFDPKVHTITPQETQTRDRFAGFEPNPTIASRETPVSTFSIDVDTASYSYLRRGLNGGRIPPARAIRVEELVNYFPYDYLGSDSADEPFRASVSVVPTPWNADTQLMHIGIKGYVPPAAERPRANIVLLIDTSGSMNAPDKLPLLINSFRLLLDTLDADDTVSIVTYAGSAGTVLEPTAASERSKIEQAFDRLRAGGSTAGAAGLRLAYDKAQESFDEDAVNRVILATDGDFNVGFSSPDAMKAYVEKKRETGVFLSVLGFGTGNYNDALMQALAQNGNGVAAYIDTLSEARKVLAGEAGGALVPIAKDVKIQVEFNPATVSEYRLIGYETRALNREDFNDDTVDAGDINSGHTVTAIYEITPAGSPAETIDPLRYENEPVAVSENASDELAFVKIRHKLPDSDTSTLQTRPVTQDDAVDRLNAADREARFAIAVAAVGQKLQGLSALSDYEWDEAIALANGAKGDDPFGYRAEFVGLARLAKSLDARR